MRKTKIVTIGEDGGRDAGKTFMLREMSSDKAERWACRALMALLGNGADIPPEAVAAGMEGVFHIGILNVFGGLRWEQVEPLLAEMMECVQVIPNPANPLVVRPLNESADDIEEVSTRILLRGELFELHLGFSLADKLQTSGLSAPTRSKMS